MCEATRSTLTGNMLVSKNIRGVAKLHIGPSAAVFAQVFRQDSRYRRHELVRVLGHRGTNTPLRFGIGHFKSCHKPVLICVRRFPYDLPLTSSGSDIADSTPP